MKAKSTWPLQCVAVVVAAIFYISPADAQGADERDQSCIDFAALSPLWRALSASGAAGDDTRTERLFPLDEVLTALRTVPLTKPLPASFADAIEYFRPPNWYSDESKVWEWTAAYAEPAKLYVLGQLPEAIRGFDVLVAQSPKGFVQNPFRAAAAYTAARAAFRLGDFDEGAIRVDRILGDRDMQEFWVAAWKLIPRIRSGTDAAPLAAAELALISRLLTLGEVALCGMGRQWGLDARGMMRSVDIGKAIAEAAEEDFSLAYYPNDFERLGAEYAKADPVIAALAAMPAYPGFDFGSFPGPWLPHLRAEHGWSAPWSGPAMSAFSKVPPDIREHWRSTRNPLWALELGRIGNEQDLPALADAIAVTRGWADDLSTRAKASLVWALAAYQARILLTAGKPADALSALSALTVDERREIASRPPVLVQGAFESVVNGGTTYLLSRGDLVRARRWAIDASTTLGWPIADDLKPILVEDLGELYRHPVLRLTLVDGLVRLGPWRELLDLWSSPRLIEFSRRYDVAPEDRRAMVGAAWIRALALRRWSDVFAWLPDLRAAFPALSPDIELIDQAWLPATRRHLATRLALRAPGLVALPSWSRPPGDVPQVEVVNDEHRPTDVLAFDPYNASDGNWWCSPKPEATAEEDRKDLVELLNANRDRDNAGNATELISKVPLLRISDDGELAALAAAGSAAQRLAEDAIAWAEHREWLSGWFGSDEHLPETLHLAVRATRFGCRRPADNSPWSRAAFRLLHERFPTSEWARKTPYWFGVIGGN